MTCNDFVWEPPAFGKSSSIFFMCVCPTSEIEEGNKRHFHEFDFLVFKVSWKV